MSFKKFLINWLDVHGKRHSVSRHVSLQRLINMGIGGE